MLLEALLCLSPCPNKKSQLRVFLRYKCPTPTLPLPPSPGDAAKLKMDADSHGGVRHWVVGSKSTPAQEAETKMMKFHLLPNHTPPPAVASNLFHLPFPPTLIHPPHPHSPHLLPPRISCFTRSPPFPPCPVSDIQLLSSPHLSSLPAQFSCLFPIIRRSPSLLFSPPAGPIPRERKRRSALSQHRFAFLSHSVWSVRKQD